MTPLFRNKAEGPESGNSRCRCGHLSADHNDRVYPRPEWDACSVCVCGRYDQEELPDAAA